MSPFIIFAAILIVIWTLSGIATWVNKMQEAERRRRVREEIAMSGMTQQQPARQPPPLRRPQPARPVQISEGIAARYPQVLQLPKPAPPAYRRQQMPQTPRIVTPPRIQRAPKRPAKQVRRTPAIPVLEEDEPRRPLVVAPIAPATPQRAPAPAPAGQRASAPALSRWLNPATLRQQFILTEIFQPPLALRDPHAH